MNLKVHSEGITEVMCANKAGRWGRGLVSTRKATFVGSYGDIGGVGLGIGGGGGHDCTGIGGQLPATCAVGSAIVVYVVS